MIRVCGVILPAKKHLNIALTSIYGVGRKTALDICDRVKLDPATKVNTLTDDQASQLQEAINDANYVVEGDLRREVAMNIKRLIDIRCYRGLRHRRGLPVRGQRTHTNARTRRGKSGKGRVNK